MPQITHAKEETGREEMERAADALDRAGRTSEPEENKEERALRKRRAACSIAVLDCSRSTKGKPFFLHAAKVGIKSKTKIDSYQGEKKIDH